MKLRTCIALLLIMLTVFTACCIPAAMANSWGLSAGTLYKFVSSTHDYDDYSAISNCVSKNGIEAAVLGSRYHNVLLLSLNKGEVQVLHTAVWQPEDTEKPPKLSVDGTALTVSYPGIGSEYTFDYDTSEFAAGYSLISYQWDDIWEYDAQRYGYVCDDLWWNTVSPIPVGQFHARLPFSGYSAEATNICCSLTGRDVLFGGTGTEIKGKKENVPVYSAPDKASYRAGNGKASVNPRGGFRYLRSDGDWDLIEYEVSVRTHRVGYIQKGYVDDRRQQENFARIPMHVTGGTYLTDDPWVSEYHSFTLPAGTAVTVLGMADYYYAYVEAEPDGQKTRGFVPAGQLTPDLPEASETRLDGAYFNTAGGGFFGTLLDFHADGTMEAYDINESAFICTDYEGQDGSWYTDVAFDNAASLPFLFNQRSYRYQLYPYNRSWGLYWADVPYILCAEFTEDAGNKVYRYYGLEIAENNSINFYTYEGSGGYAPVTGFPDVENAMIGADTSAEN
ncbi:MAG: hypothetical protein MJ142_02870 [Clostridia bacterium]|nr:hypothetical protein [Clostridia bacterium]